MTGRSRSRAKLEAKFSSPQVGLVVEGRTEYDALPKLHALLPGCPALKPFNLRGVGGTATPLGIANAALKPVIAHFASGCGKVVVCIDRENRDDCSGEFARAVLLALKSLLKKKGRENADVHVVVANRAFEAWILADAVGFHVRRVFKVKPNFHSFEGRTGEHGRFGTVELTKMLGRDYMKTRDGPMLFAQVDFAEARKCRPGERGSKSLDKLLRALDV